MRDGGVGIVCLLLLGARGFAQPCRLDPLQGGGLPGGGEALYCTPEKLSVRSASLAVLVDDSGSMAGHRAVMPQLLSWLESASSRLATRGVQYAETRGCYFSSARSLEHCADARVNPRGFLGKAATTLNEAVRYASGFDLAVIVTDGVGNVGGGPACASGVDAACLAAELAEAMAPRGGEPSGLLPGLWLVPLVSLYEGPFFTEQAFPARQLDAQQVSANVSADTGQAAAVRNPREDSQGLLVYDYRGPRFFLLVVLARRVELGRAFLGALAGAQSFNRVTALGSARNLPQGLARLNAIEVFPGIAPQVSGFAKFTVDPRACRTITAVPAGPAQIRLDCPNPSDEGTVYLSAQPPQVSSECVVIQNLPAAIPRLIASDASRVPVKDSRWTGSATEANRPLQLSLRLQCRRAWSFPCPKEGVRVSWRVTMDYRTTVSRLASAPQSPADRTVEELSASSVIDRPHRLLQLREALEAFYRNILPVRPSTEDEVARLTFCKP